ncbi:MAG: hypothetical protein K2Q20_05650 [Phycisphaerales bacterium]|nr:hypothetical protein [Phycisphaerales bacterium]
MMTPTSGDPRPNPTACAPKGRKALLASLSGMAAGLVIVAIMVGKSIVGSTPTGVSAAQPRAGVAESVEAGLEAASTYMRQKQFAEASAILGKLSERSPTDQAVRVAFAQSLLGEQKFAPAYEQYEAAIALMGMPAMKPSAGADSAASAGAVVRNPVGAQLHFEAGTCANMAGKPERAVEHYWMAQVLDPAEARYPLFLGMMQIKTGDTQAANASLLRAAKLKPDLAEAWGTMAELAVQQNRLGLAEQHLQKARLLQPEVARWRIVEARVANRQGKPEQAAQLMLALDEKTRNSKEVLSLLGESFGLLGRPEDAAKAWGGATKVYPTDAEVFYQAALWSQRAKLTDAAAGYAKTAAQLGSAEAKAMVEQLAQTTP